MVASRDVRITRITRQLVGLSWLKKLGFLQVGDWKFLFNPTINNKYMWLVLINITNQQNIYGPCNKWKNPWNLPFFYKYSRFLIYFHRLSSLPLLRFFVLPRSFSILLQFFKKYFRLPFISIFFLLQFFFLHHLFLFFCNF